MFSSYVQYLIFVWHLKSILQTSFSFHNDFTLYLFLLINKLFMKI